MLVSVVELSHVFLCLLPFMFQFLQRLESHLDTRYCLGVLESSQIKDWSYSPTGLTFWSSHPHGQSQTCLQTPLVLLGTSRCIFYVFVNGLDVKVWCCDGNPLREIDLISLQQCIITFESIYCCTYKKILSVLKCIVFTFQKIQQLCFCFVFLLYLDLSLGVITVVRLFWPC